MVKVIEGRGDEEKKIHEIRSAQKKEVEGIQARH
jgi:hypothetical protein